MPGSFHYNIQQLPEFVKSPLDDDFLSRGSFTGSVVYHPIIRLVVRSNHFLWYVSASIILC